MSDVSVDLITNTINKNYQRTLKETLSYSTKNQILIKHFDCDQLAVSLTLFLYSIFVFRYFYSHFSHDSSYSLFSHIIDLFNKQYFIIKVKELLLQADISTTGFSSHFLCKKVAIFIAANEISYEEIKLLNHWKNNTIDVYINKINIFEYIQKLL